MLSTIKVRWPQFYITGASKSIFQINFSLIVICIVTNLHSSSEFWKTKLKFKNQKKSMLTFSITISILKILSKYVLHTKFLTTQYNTKMCCFLYWINNSFNVRQKKVQVFSFVCVHKICDFWIAQEALIVIYLKCHSVAVHFCTHFAFKKVP
jgi:hypothetical protein